MTPNQSLAIILIVAGVVLFVIGVTASDSFADQISRTFTGHFTDQTTWYLLGGIASALAGAFLLFFGTRAARV
jgi:hypothetical protein